MPKRASYDTMQIQGLIKDVNKLKKLDIDYAGFLITIAKVEDGLIVDIYDPNNLHRILDGLMVFDADL